MKSFSWQSMTSGCEAPSDFVVVSPPLPVPVADDYKQVMAKLPGRTRLQARGLIDETGTSAGLVESRGNCGERSNRSSHLGRRDLSGAGVSAGCCRMNCGSCSTHHPWKYPLVWHVG